MKNGAGLIIGLVALGSLGLLIATASASPKTHQPGTIVEGGTIQNYEYRIVASSPGSEGAFFVQVKLLGFGTFDSGTTIGFAQTLDGARQLAKNHINELLGG